MFRGGILPLFCSSRKKGDLKQFRIGHWITFYTSVKKIKNITYVTNWNNKSCISQALGSNFQSSNKLFILFKCNIILILAKESNNNNNC